MSELKIVEDGVKLIFDKSQSVDANLPIRWCITPEVRERIVNEEFVQVWLFLSITDEKGREQERKLLRLDTLMTYLAFKRPGKHIINAVVVGTTLSGKNVEREIRKALSRCAWSNEFLYDLYEEAGERLEFRPEWLSAFGQSLYVLTTTSVEVEVANQFFAKEPPKWLKSWAMALWSSPLVDQCDFRKRLIFAFTVQPFVMVCVVIFFYPFSVLYRSIRPVFGFLLGARPHPSPNFGINWREIFSHELIVSSDEIWCGGFDSCAKEYRDKMGYKTCGGNFFAVDRDGEPRPFYWVLGTPTIWATVLTCSVIYFAWQGQRGMDLLTTSVTNVIYSVAFVAVFLTIGLLTAKAIWQLVQLISVSGSKKKNGLAWHSKRLRIQVEEFFRERRRERAEEAKMMQSIRLAEMAEAQNLVVCQLGASKRADIRELPKEKRTLILHFHALKARVCRPFARN